MKSTYPVTEVLRKLFRIDRSIAFWYVILTILIFTSVTAGLGITQGLREIADAASGKNLRLLEVGLEVGLISLSINFVVRWTRFYLAARLSNRLTLSLQDQVVRGLMNAKMSEYERYHTADLISRIADAASKAISGLNSTSLSLIGNSSQIIATLIYLSYISVPLTIGVVFLCGVFPLLLIPLSGYLRRIYDERWKAQALAASQIQDAVQGAEIVRSYSLQNVIMEKFLHTYARITQIVKKSSWIGSVLKGSDYLITSAGFLFVFGYGGYLVVGHALSIGSVVAYIFSFERITSPLQTIMQNWPRLLESITGANRVFELLDLEQEQDSVMDGQKVFLPIKGDALQIVFEGISYAYGTSERALNDISFVALPGQTTALVGPSGGGKSTVIKLLLRLYDPSTGTIRYGDDPLTTLTLSEWRKRIAYVAQDASLFSGTILDNIRLGNPAATDQEVRTAAATAHIHHVIASMPDGYYTFIGEKGASLSGGERQRIAIARAILRDPEILLLDEPTSALDNESENIVHQALQQLMNGRTTILVAHRLSAIRTAGRIVYIERGMVLEEGTHDELLTKGRHYASLLAAGHMGTV